MTNPRHLSKTAEHFTPLNIVEAARVTMGGIDLDPATTIEANKFIRAKRIYTEKENGFTRLWKGRVFLNPPGGRCDPHTGLRLDAGGGVSSAKTWWYKLVAEFNTGRVEAAIFVMFSIELLQSSQVNAPKGLSGVLPLHYPICFPSRRISYMTRERGKFVPSTQPPHASAIVCVSSMPDVISRFGTEFGRFGRCIRPKGG